MNSERELLAKWRELPFDKQQQVLHFAESLREQPKKTELGQRLRQIRNNILASELPLLNREEIEKELASRRGELQDNE